MRRSLLENQALNVRIKREPAQISGPAEMGICSLLRSGCSAGQVLLLVRFTARLNRQIEHIRSYSLPGHRYDGRRCAQLRYLLFEYQAIQATRILRAETISWYQVKSITFYSC